MLNKKALIRYIMSLKLSAAQKLYLRIILDHYKPSLSGCSLSNKEMADYLNLSVRGTQRIRSFLQQKKMIGTKKQFNEDGGQDCNLTVFTEEFLLLANTYKPPKKEPDFTYVISRDHYASLDEMV